MFYRHKVSTASNLELSGNGRIKVDVKKLLNRPKVKEQIATVETIRKYIVGLK